MTVDITSTARVRIFDDETLRLAVEDVTVNEGDGSVQVGIVLNNAVPGGFSIRAFTSGGTATENSDFRRVDRTLNFAGNEDERQTLTVPITDDNIVEGVENFRVSLSQSGWHKFDHCNNRHRNGNNHR